MDRQLRSQAADVRESPHHVAHHCGLECLCREDLRQLPDTLDAVIICLPGQTLLKRFKYLVLLLPAVLCAHKSVDECTELPLAVRRRRYEQQLGPAPEVLYC